MGVVERFFPEEAIQGISQDVSLEYVLSLIHEV